MELQAIKTVVSSVRFSPCHPLPYGTACFSAPPHLPYGTAGFSAPPPLLSYDTAGFAVAGFAVQTRRLPLGRHTTWWGHAPAALIIILEITCWVLFVSVLDKTLYRFITHAIQGTKLVERTILSFLTPFVISRNVCF